MRTWGATRADTAVRIMYIMLNKMFATDVYDSIVYSPDLDPLPCN